MIATAAGGNYYLRNESFSVNEHMPLWTRTMLNLYYAELRAALLGTKAQITASSLRFVYRGIGDAQLYCLESLSDILKENYKNTASKYGFLFKCPWFSFYLRPLVPKEADGFVQLVIW